MAPDVGTSHIAARKEAEDGLVVFSDSSCWLLFLSRWLLLRFLVIGVCFRPFARPWLVQIICIGQHILHRGRSVASLNIIGAMPAAGSNSARSGIAR